MSLDDSTSSVLQALPRVLSEAAGGTVEVQKVWRLGGGASKEAWAVDARFQKKDQQWLVRRMGGGVIHDHTLALHLEHAVIQAAYLAGVPVPKPIGLPFDLSGKDAFLMERMHGEGIGRRIVRNLTNSKYQQAAQSLTEQMAQALAKIHKVPRIAVPELPVPNECQSAAQRTIENLVRKLDEAQEPHPAIELGLRELKRRLSESGADQPNDLVLVHGDFRIGNLLVDTTGLTSVIDWEFAHWGHPLEDLAWPLVRAWRFGQDEQHVGGVGDVNSYLSAYNIASGSKYTSRQLAWWELAGNVRWAISCLTQARRHLSGAELNVELALLGRLASEVEHEILDLISDNYNHRGTHAG